LNVPRFINIFYTSELLGDNSRPSQALLSTVYLWGVNLSSIEVLKSYESVFLGRATRRIARDLSGDHPQKAKHALQAEVLLSRYYFSIGSFLEGRYHCSAAVSIALSLGFHRIRSMQGLPPNTPSVDTVEEGERINAFWTVFFDDKCWAVAMDVPSAFPDHKTVDGRIDTPWPLDMAQYEKACNPSHVTTSLVTFSEGLIDI
jgi:Fungal specific transcription factor domain